MPGRSPRETSSGGSQRQLRGEAVTHLAIPLHVAPVEAPAGQPKEPMPEESGEEVRQVAAVLPRYRTSEEIRSLSEERREATAQSAGLPRQGILQLADQGRNILCDRLDDDVEVDAGVAVDDLVPHPDDAVPGDVWMSLADLCRCLGGRLADDLEQSLDREVPQAFSGDFRCRPPLASSTASRAASSMCRIRIRSSCRVMKRDGFAEDLIPEVRTERSWGP